MEEFTSADLQKRIGDVLVSTEVGPTVLLNRGQPRIVLLSAEEFRRLKTAAGEPIPRAALPRKPLVLKTHRDPLGYDTSDFNAAALAMADDALSGRTSASVRSELERVRIRFGIACVADDAEPDAPRP